MKWIATAAGLAIAVTLGLFGLSAAGFIDNPLFFSRTDSTLSEHVFTVELDGTILIVDGRHLRRIHRQPLGAVKQVDLALPWPSRITDLSAPQVRDEITLKNTVFVSMRRRDGDVTTEDRLERLYPVLLETGSGTTRYGLTLRAFHSQSAYAGQELYSGKFGDKPVAIRCDAESGSDVEPMCDRQLTPPQGPAVVYRFHKTHLPGWRKIEALVNTLIDMLLRET